MEQDKVSESSLFVTLTYDTRYVPITANGFMTLCKADVQKFIKRLRKCCPLHVKYYACGEYGGARGRPHYHLILFNATYQAVLDAWRLDKQSLGHVHFGKVSGASIGYCLKYMMKPRINKKHGRDDRVIEFQLTSKGLGVDYLNDVMVQWHKADLLNRMYLNIEDGKKIAMPRYYKDKLYSDSEREAVSNFQMLEMSKRQEEKRKEREERYGDDALRVREEFIISSQKSMYVQAEKGRDKI